VSEPDAKPTANPRVKLPRVVVWLGVVSFATDASTEMIYPLLPLFLTAVLHAGASFVGAVEGAAEATAALLKLVSGQLADRARRRKPLTVFGYSISSAVRPLTGLATAPWMVLALRVADRVGKGVRSSPRDALLADATPPAHRGRAFGFHHAMDNAGAVLGPAIAFSLLLVFGLSLRTVFLLSAIPGALAVAALVFGVRETPREPAPPGAHAAAAAAARVPSAPFWRYLFVLALFALGNSSDAFLLLRARQLHVADAYLPLLWMLHNATKAALSTWGGALSDRVGRRRVIAAGWFVYGLVYEGFGAATQAWHIWALFAAYGLYYALTEGSEKALIAELVPASSRGRAYGLYYAVVGLVALPASIGFGFIAEHESPLTAFTAAAVLAAVASLLLVLLVPERAPAE
jgi:MFS family permease